MTAAAHSPSSSLLDGADRGLFITVEGIDGSGKSTQAERCAQKLQERFKAEGLNTQVILTRNPGATAIGREIRNLLLHSPKESDDPTAVLTSTAELMLYMADRAHHMETVILPALRQGHVVLCDRHMDSSVAYQGYGRGLDIETIHRLNAMATLGKTPDATLLFDGDPAVLAQRVQKRGAGGQGVDRLEQEALEFYIRVRQGYLELRHQNPQRFHTIDATGSLDAVTEATMETLLKIVVQSGRYGSLSSASHPISS